MSPTPSESAPGWPGPVFGPRREGPGTGVRRRTPATRRPTTGRRGSFPSVLSRPVGRSGRRSGGGGGGGGRQGDEADRAMDRGGVGLDEAGEVALPEQPHQVGRLVEVALGLRARPVLPRGEPVGDRLAVVGDVAEQAGGGEGSGGGGPRGTHRGGAVRRPPPPPR